MYSQDFLHGATCWWSAVLDLPAVDLTSLALSGEDGIPSPPEGAFFMVKDSWLHEGCHTDSRRKWTMDRTNKDNLSLSNCVFIEYKVNLGEFQPHLEAYVNGRINPTISHSLHISA
jgi:hypothetical protein